MIPAKEIHQYSLPELEELIKSKGEKSFRARQVWEWVWKKGARSFDEMTNLSANLRRLLKENCVFHTIHLQEKYKSSDGTRKFLFGLHDDETIEAVLIPSGKRATACISSQTGCKLGCVFCATGQISQARNLQAGEICDQYFYLNKICEETYNHPLTNVVFMGMGEPLLNYEQVRSAILHITSPDEMNFSPQRITLSTAGIPDKIRLLGEEDLKIILAISLHSANDKKRSELMPLNKTYPLKSLHDSLVSYFNKTGRRITIEYLLLDGINDGKEDASQLVAFCSDFPCKINLITYNPVFKSGLKPSPPEKTAHFLELLEKKNLIVLCRKSRGSDIIAACGQLAGGK